MSLAKKTTTAIIGKFGANEKDTGNTNVQVALLTERIKELSAHCKQFKKDKTASHGIIKAVGRRRRLLTYLQRSNLEGYRSLIKELDLRK
jgi:small subunit ribosomal protein S15